MDYFDHESPVEHEVKSWPRLFAGLLDRTKRFELRRDDRGYEVGDFMRQREYDPEAQTYTGRWIRSRITYKTSAENPCALSDGGLQPGFCILSIVICHTDTDSNNHHLNK
ncbi:MAG: DUF3850 domain-containing protein [Oxalobacteraceae bacterium]|nr:MAG: DUF3850 domain-containing protein [Oxalobacteraceae bacterium]